IAGFLSSLEARNGVCLLSAPFPIPEAGETINNCQATIFESIAKLKIIVQQMHLTLKPILLSDESARGVLILLEGVIERLSETQRSFEEAVLKSKKSSENERVSWFCLEKREANFYAAPLNVQFFLKNGLYKKLDSMIMTSATLKVGNNFEFFKDRLGLFDDVYNVLDLTIESPFDYENQVLCHLASEGFWPLEGASLERFGDFMLNLLKMIPRGCFLLFTSIKDMNNAYDFIAERVRDLGITPLKQGDKPPFQIILEFKRQKPAVLFAVDSFWEGVDIQGDALFSLVFLKIPFDVPTEPLFQSKSYIIEKNGKNPFMQYALPRAILSLKQGVGRLLRSESDRGLVFLLDSRIWSKSYGRKIISSLPGMQISKGDLSGFLNYSRTYFNLEGGEGAQGETFS
ncbi:ATP-dependent DNA helicase, partial [Candidatus Riflebacteria bacterium]